MVLEVVLVLWPGMAGVSCVDPDVVDPDSVDPDGVLLTTAEYDRVATVPPALPAASWVLGLLMSPVCVESFMMNVSVSIPCPEDG